MGENRRSAPLLAGERPAGNTRRLHIGFILARSFTLSPFALFVDTLRLASDKEDKSGRVLADWDVLASTRHLITSSCGVPVAPTADLVDPRLFDYIVVVGGLLTIAEPVDDETTAYLRKAASLKVPLIGVCTGTFILAEAGLMKDHQACVSWLHHQAYRDRFPGHRLGADRIFFLDRDRGSCAGGTSAADLAASLVRRHIGRDAERNALEVLQIERARTSHEVQPRRPLAIDSTDARLQRALIRMEQHTEDKVPLGEIASSIGVSRRQLERLFIMNAGMTPAYAYKKIRLERARHLLSLGKSSVSEVALECGFANLSHFSRSYKAAFGETPVETKSGGGRT